jgi:hypothetical protein
MLLPVVLALLGRGATALAGEAGLQAPATAKLNLTDPAALDEFERQWLARAQRIPTEVMLPCPVSCSKAGSDAAAWDLYPDAARMAVCNETVLFEMPIDTDVAPTALRVWYVLQESPPLSLPVPPGP